MRVVLVSDAFGLSIQTMQTRLIFAMMHIVVLHLIGSCAMKLQIVIFPDVDVLN